VNTARNRIPGAIRAGSVRTSSSLAVSVSPTKSSASTRRDAPRHAGRSARTAMGTITATASAVSVSRTAQRFPEPCVPRKERRKPRSNADEKGRFAAFPASQASCVIVAGTKRRSAAAESSTSRRSTARIRSRTAESGAWRRNTGAQTRKRRASAPAQVMMATKASHFGITRARGWSAGAGCGCRTTAGAPAAGSTAKANAPLVAALSPVAVAFQTTV
jgi:hypothetical protein